MHRILAGEGCIFSKGGSTRLAEGGSRAGRTPKLAVGARRAYPVENGRALCAFLRRAPADAPQAGQLDAPGAHGAAARSSRTCSRRSSLPGPPLALSVARGDPAEFKARLLWNFTQFLVRSRPAAAGARAREPAVVGRGVARAAALRRAADLAEKLLLLCTYNATERDLNPTLRTTEQSLVALGVAQVHQLRPLSREATEDLIREVFHTEKGATREFSALLYGWTRGNPFFIEETLKALIESGQLYERDGAWLGWELDTLQLPRSIREAVIARVDRLSPNARTVANLAAVIARGRPTSSAVR